MKDEHILLVKHFFTSEMCEINQVIIKIDWYLSPTGNKNVQHSYLVTYCSIALHVRHFNVITCHQ